MYNNRVFLDNNSLVILTFADDSSIINSLLFYGINSYSYNYTFTTMSLIINSDWELLDPLNFKFRQQGNKLFI